MNQRNYNYNYSEEDSKEFGACPRVRVFMNQISQELNDQKVSQEEMIRLGLLQPDVKEVDIHRKPFFLEKKVKWVGEKGDEREGISEAEGGEAVIKMLN